MMDVEEIKEILRKQLSQKRYLHTLGVQDTAIALAVRYGVSTQQAGIAGLVHDCAKDLTYKELLNYVEQFDIMLDDVTKNQHELIHGIVGAKLAETVFHIQDEEVLNAVRFHTTGKADMNLLEKIIYLADFIEPTREIPGVDKLRKMALSDIDKATLMAFDSTIQYVIERGSLLHPNTIHGRNSLLFRIGGLGQE